MKFSIKYITPSEFKTLSKNRFVKEVSRYPHYRFSDSITSTDDKFTREINTCTALVINDTMFHLAPELEEINLCQKVKNFISEIKDKTNSVQGFMLGALSKRNDFKSYRQFEELRNVLEQENVDYSALGGKILEEKLDELYVKNNTMIFSQTGNIGLEELMNNKDLTRKDIIKILKYYYSTVKISKNHSLIV